MSNTRRLALLQSFLNCDVGTSLKDMATLFVERGEHGWRTSKGSPPSMTDLCRKTLMPR